jgi:hypothetical protein
MEQYGDGVSLFAGGASGNPDADGVAVRLGSEQLHEGALQRLKGLGIPEKSGD